MAELYSFENLWRQYRACRRNKRKTVNQLRFEIDAEASLLDLQRELREHTYQPGRSICFVTDGPKPREVFAADFRDRIVHHVLVSRLEPIFEPRFIHDSYACRKGKGVLAASERLTAFLRSATSNGGCPAYALQLDVARFFASIHKETLYGIIARHVRDSELLWLTRVILFHDPTVHYHFRRGPRGSGVPGSAGYRIAAQKSLFGGNNERGLPIGNLTSQFWANVYLNELDHFVKRELKCRWYVRYVDDLVLLHREPAELLEWREAIARFLAARLRLGLRDPAAAPRPVRDGIDFVGWKTFRDHRCPRGRTLENCERKLQRFEREQVRRRWNGAALAVDMTSDAAPVEKLRSTLTSYSGHLRHGGAWCRWVDIRRRHGWLDALFVADPRRSWRVETRWPLRSIAGPRFSRQYGQLIRHAGDRALVFCQVGRFFEFYGPQRQAATAALRLLRTKIARGGFAFSVGFPVTLHATYLSRAVRAGYTVVEVREVGRLDAWCTARRVTGLWFPAESAAQRQDSAHPGSRTGRPGGRELAIEEERDG